MHNYFIDKMCDSGSVMDIAAWEPPAKNQTRIMFELAERVTRICCADNASLSIDRYALNPRDLEEGFRYEQETMVLPVSRTMSRTCETGNPYYQFIGMMESPGEYYITNSKEV